MELDYTVPTTKSYDDAVQAVQDAAAANGFRVQFVHDVAATLAEKGFEREPVTIVEVCNAKHAAAVLAADIRIGLMLPCPVMVYERGRRGARLDHAAHAARGVLPGGGHRGHRRRGRGRDRRIVDEAPPDVPRDRRRVAAPCRGMQPRVYSAPNRTRNRR